MPMFIEPTSFVFLIPVFLLGYYITYIIQLWEKEFAGHRLKRTHERSPSFKQYPSAKTFDDKQSHIQEIAKKHDLFSTIELIDHSQERQKKWNKSSDELSSDGVLESRETAEQLNMDHVYIRFLDFLWGYLFIAPMTYLLYASGITMLKVRDYLHKQGFLNVEEPDFGALVGALCLEQTQVMNYYATRKNNVAAFLFSDFPYVDNNCRFCTADLFSVEIDLATKRFARATLDNVDLNPSETFILLSFNTVGAQHVKLHSMANWGTNDDTSLKTTNPFLRRNSIVTAMYNFFGYTNFHNCLAKWETEGILTQGLSEKRSLMTVFNHGIKEGVGQHRNIYELVPHSRFVNFSVKVRAIFLNEFSKHKDLFPGIDGEALFVGTILHSLDHTFLEWNVADPLWLDVNDPKFGTMAELTRIVRAGFTEDVPFLYFNKRFSGSDHPFYKRVYQKAVKIDKVLADHIDTCIIK